MKIIICIILVSVLIVSCAPGTATPVSTATAIPTSTVTPTVTQTPVVYLSGLSMNVPEPGDEFIGQIVSENYLSVMNLTKEQVMLTYQEQSSIDGEPYVVMVDLSTRVPLAIYMGGSWQKSTLKFFGQQVGIMMGTDTAEGPAAVDKKVYEEFDWGTILVGNSWQSVEPQKGEIDYNELRKSNKVLQELKEAGITTNITHVILCSSDYPDWLKTGNFNQVELRAIMKSRIEYVIRNTPDDSSYIVVNEPWEFDTPSQEDDIFYKAWGNSYEYIAEAFQIARETADAMGRKEVKLIFNNSDNHYAIGITSQSSRQVVMMLKKENLIDYLGMQMHIGEWQPGAFDELMVPQMPAEIQFYKELGVPVLITELTYQPDEHYALSEATSVLQPKEFEQRLSYIFGEVFRIAIESGNVKGITFWGLTDKWFKLDNVNWYQIFDENGQPKQAYYEVLRTLYEGIK